MTLQFKAAHSRHPQVEEKATRLSHASGAEKFFRRCIRLRAQTRGLEKPPGGASHGDVVVNDGYQR